MDMVPKRLAERQQECRVEYGLEDQQECNFINSEFQRMRDILKKVETGEVTALKAGGMLFEPVAPQEL